MSSMINPSRVESLLYLIPLIPMLAAAVNGLFGRRLGRENAQWLAVGAVGASFVISLGVFLSMLGGTERLYHVAYDWIVVGEFRIPIAFAADHLTSVMLLVITGIGFFIHLYSVGYMAHDDGVTRYFSYLNLFVGMMLVLVLGDSLPVLFVGWEGVGLCSYLLIGFWYSDTEKAIAGKKAFIVNRVGDLGFIIGMFVLFSVFGTLSFSSLNAAAGSVNVDSVIPAASIFGGWTYGQAITFAVLALFVGCTGKSAQIPLFVWLPDAMAGPTPVSALIHAATMVTSGVYLLVRLSPMVVLSPSAMWVIAIIGAATALVGAFMGLFQRGIKKVLAYSTVSQLGYMFLGVGVGAFYAGTYHLFTHAFFKACLFLGAGAVMHAMGNEEDIHLFGGLHKKIPHTHWTFLIATVAISGIIPISGFFSKDAILYETLLRDSGAGPALAWTLWGMGALAAFFTSTYMWRLYFLTFRGTPRNEHLHDHAHESPWTMTSALWVLAIGAIVVAAFGLPHFVQNNSELFAHISFHHWLAGVTASDVVPTPHHPNEFLFLGIALAIAWAGFALAWTVWGKAEVKGDATAKRTLGVIYTASYERLWWDQSYLKLIVFPLVAFAKGLWWVVDVILIDRLLVEGSAKVARLFGSLLRPIQNGDAQRYAAVVAIGAALLLAAFVGWKHWGNEAAGVARSEVSAPAGPVAMLQTGTEVIQ
ncbi:MAG: NADH-quinone oxidoreductase subunit L [Deltaproteobacteria bacterium]|nr:NADH-quinone oxidoreductase subunit L [Deltaproteobacteria bacterium]